MSEEEQRDPAAKSGVGEEVGMVDWPGTSSPRGLKLTEAHLSAIADKVVERLTAGKATPNGQGEEVIRLVSQAAHLGVEFTRHASQGVSHSGWPSQPAQGKLSTERSGQMAQHRLHWGRQWGQAILGGPASLLRASLAQSGWAKGPAQTALGRAVGVGHIG